jgi:hypothetical protein
MLEITRLKTGGCNRASLRPLYSLAAVGVIVPGMNSASTFAHGSGLSHGSVA